MFRCLEGGSSRFWREKQPLLWASMQGRACCPLHNSGTDHALCRVCEQHPCRCEWQLSICFTEKVLRKVRKSITQSAIQPPNCILKAYARRDGLLLPLLSKSVEVHLLEETKQKVTTQSSAGQQAILTPPHQPRDIW